MSSSDSRLALQTAALTALASPVCLACIVIANAFVEQQGLGGAQTTVQSLWGTSLAMAAAGAVIGFASGHFHQRWLAFHEAVATGQASTEAPPLQLMRLGVVRFFAHLPFYLAPTFFAVVWATVSRLWRRPGTVDVLEAGGGLTPIWFQLGPLMPWFTGNDFPGTPPTLPRLALSMPRWAWWLPVMIVVADQGGEIYGEPLVLLAAGTYWVGDYASLWWVLRARVLSGSGLSQKV